MRPPRSCCDFISYEQPFAIGNEKSLALIGSCNSRKTNPDPLLAGEKKLLCVFKNYETREAEVGNQNLSYIHFDKKISISDDDFRRRGYA